MLENLNSCSKFQFLPNKLIFCCRNYSRAETICENAVDRFLLCCWHIIRKVIWYVTKLRIFKIFFNVCLFLSSCLCPLGFLSFVSWKKNQDKILRNISRFLTSRFRQIAFLMTCQQHKFVIWHLMEMTWSGY